MVLNILNVPQLKLGCLCYNTTYSLSTYMYYREYLIKIDITNVSADINK